VDSDSILGRTVLKGHDFNQLAEKVDALKGYGFQPCRNRLIFDPALATEGCTPGEIRLFLLSQKPREKLDSTSSNLPIDR
jgi:hypothetical protein